MRAVVVGGGPAGAACAMTLASRGAKVTVVARTPVAERPAECVMPADLVRLRALGFGALFDRHAPFTGIEGSLPLPFVRDFVREPYGEGRIVDRARLDEDLAGLATSAGVRWLVGSALRVERSAGWRVTFEAPAHEGWTLEAEILVDATGRDARMARALGAKRVTERPMTASWMRGTSAERDLRLRVGAAGGAWWYRTVLGGVESWVRCATRAPDALEGEFAALRRDTPAFARLVPGALKMVAHIRAGSGRTFPCRGEGWIAVGEAALALEPFGGSGIACAIAMGYYGAHAAVDAVRGEPAAGPAYDLLVERYYADARSELDARRSALSAELPPGVSTVNPR